MASGRFVQVAQPKRRNEFSALGQAFNQLSRTLRRQFRLLATLERMDQAILQRPAIEELVESMLPRLPEILDCECVGISVSGMGRPVYGWADRSGKFERPSGSSSGALEQLRNQRPELQWEQMPLRVSGVTRGWLLCGRDGAMPRAIRRQAKGVARRFAVALRNEERERLLLRQALTDELTQLPNRRQLQEHVQQVLDEASAAGESFAFVYLDLDRFKTLNDSLGHRCGDELLFQLAGMLNGALEPADMVARVGGDEFALLLRNVDCEAAQQRLEAVQTKMREPLHVGGISIQPQASIGIAMFPADGRDFDVLLRNADVAMYRGKVAGGGRIVFFEERMNEQAVRRLQIESLLRQAVGTNRLQLHFQPKVSLADGSLHGVEALLRWEEPGLGFVSPAEFIPVAEESELIQELGRFALERALEFCRQCMDSNTPVGHVAVNVSMLQLCDAGLVDFLQRQLSVRRVPAAMLQIEITESSIMRDAAMVQDVLGKIRNLGIRIAIDDFGTGYSSLAVLQHLPVNMLKIDRSFIAPIGQSMETLELVRAMLAVCRALGLESVAEGVETAEHHDLLAANGCDYAQGYLYSRAVSGPAALELIRGWHLRQEPTPWIMSA
jgi:diguanylate cyclase (GGDEF)-like protein